MTIRPWLLILFATASALARAGTEPAVAPERDPSRLKELVVRLGSTAVRIRLLARLDGKPWRDQVAAAEQARVADLFHQLDGDGNGFLSNAEAKRLPKPGSLVPRLDEGEVHVAFNFRVLDQDRDGQVGAEELARYLGRFVGRPLTVVTPELERVGQRDDLFQQLDVDRDGRLTRSECAALGELWKNDRDGNRCLSAEELAPPVASVGGQEFVAQPLRRVAPDERLSVETAEPFDTPAGTPLIVIEFELSESLWSADHVAPVRIVSSELTAEQRGRVETTPRGAALVLHGHRVELTLVPPVFRRQQELTRAALRQFEAAAEEREGSVGRSPDLPPLLRTLFEIADRNGDGRLLRDELTQCLSTYVASQMQVEANSLQLTVTSPRSDLAGLCDDNLDGRLSGRELARLPDRLFGGPEPRDEVPRHGSGSVTRIVLQRGPFFGEGGTSLPEGGPPWFLHADRNHDGDLDPLEFLGGTSLFAEADSNHDGWIDLREGIAADGRWQKRPVREVQP